MEIKFECPNCGLAMEASAEQVHGTLDVRCPHCGQQFAVDAQPVQIPVVKAKAYSPVPAAPSQPRVPRGPAHRAMQRPPLRPADDSGDKWKLIGLAGAGVVLVAGVIWFMNLDPGKKAEPTAEQKEAARQEEEQKVRDEAAAAERARMDAELQKMKDKIASEEKIKQQAEEERRAQERLRETEKLEQAQENQTLRVDYFAENGFGGDRTAAEAFIKAVRVSAMELADLMNDGDTSNDPQTRAEADRYVADRVVWHFERDEVLTRWAKDHNREVRKFVMELLRQQPSRGGGDESTPKFDFSKYASMGSGFWISSDGWMLTNEHVVSDAKTVDLRLQDGQLIEASVVKANEADDLALIKANFTPKAWLAVSKGNVDLTLGRTVFTVGYPHPTLQGVAPKFADGRISAASGFGDRKDSYQITVPIQGGNSGGPLVDFSSGWVVGVINSKLVTGDNVSYAIKSKVASTFVDTVTEAKDAVAKSTLSPLPKGNEQAVIDRATKSAVLILRKRD